MTVTIKKEIEILSFDVPETILDSEGKEVPWDSLNWEAINSLCDEFRKGVFAKTKIKDSRTF